jgi:hypothetical protein
METQQKLIQVDEQSDGCTRCFCAPGHSVVLQFNALDPAGQPMFPGTHATEFTISTPIFWFGLWFLPSRPCRSKHNNVHV